MQCWCRAFRAGPGPSGADASPLLDFDRRIGSRVGRVAWQRSKSSNRAKRRRGLALHQLTQVMPSAVMVSVVEVEAVLVAVGARA